MKKNNPSEEEIEKKRPFYFRKKEVSDEQIDAHWQKIASKIALNDDQVKIEPGKHL